MQPDIYKPIITVSIMPVEEHDSFQFATQSYATKQNAPAYSILSLFSLTLPIFQTLTFFKTNQI